MMDGTIRAESEYGQGSRFVVRLPQGVVDNTPIGAEVTQNLKTFRMLDSRRDKEIVRIPIPDAKVLIVDDVLTNLDVAKGLMSPYGMTIHCTSSGIEAVKIIKEEKTRYDAIFMDHMMPEMDGIEAVRVIREEIGTDYAKNVRIIALTANALVGNEKMFLEKGFQAFLPKPIDAVRLDEVLNAWVRKDQSVNALPRWEVGPVSSPGADESSRAITKHRIEGVDLAGGISRFGKAEAYMKIIRSYVAHTPALLDSLRSVSDETLGEYAVTIHGIKGSSYGMCADKVGRMAEDLEHAAKRRDIETVKSKNGAFIDAAESLISQLSALEKAVSDRTSNVKKELRAAPDKILLEKLQKSCMRFDVVGMEEIMSELKRYEYATNDELIEWLEGQLNNLEYDSMLERLESELTSA
jgi:CheY-like chemotaxis protein